MRRQVLGWAAISISTLTACFWAFWGSNENFHEGWFSPSVWQNLLLLIVQYLSPMLIVMASSMVALRWPRVALPLFLAVAFALTLFFRAHSQALLVFALPLLLLGLLYQFGRPEPLRWAWRCLIGLPLLTVILSGSYPGWRAIHRVDDGNYGMRRIEGNGFALLWAPEGPGWPAEGATWQQAARSCAYLVADGHSLGDEPQRIWRLPTVDEAVRSLVFRGVNAGGSWDAAIGRARYRTRPEKDAPLWKVHSPVIYLWTGTELATDQVYYVAYNGSVLLASKRIRAGDLAFRCVSEPQK